MENAPLDYNEPSQSAWGLATTYGFIWGMLVVVLQLSLYLTVGIDVSGSFSAPAIFSTIASIAIAIFMINKAIVRHRDENQKGRITLGQCLKVGLMTSLICAIIYMIYNFVFTTFIEPDLTAEIFEQTLEEMDDSGSSEEEIEMSRKIFSFFNDPILLNLLTLVYLLLRGAFFSLILGLAAKTD